MPFFQIVITSNDISGIVQDMTTTLSSNPITLNNIFTTLNAGLYECNILNAQCLNHKSSVLHASNEFFLCKIGSPYFRFLGNSNSSSIVIPSSSSTALFGNSNGYKFLFNCQGPILPIELSITNYNASGFLDNSLFWSDTSILAVILNIEYTLLKQ